MVKAWKEFESEEKSDIMQSTGSIAAAGLAAIADVSDKISQEWGNKTFSEIRENNPSKFVKTQQRWCDNFVAESYGKRKNITKPSAAYNLVKEMIDSKEEKVFTLKDILKWLNAENISDGGLQRKALFTMVCQGKLEVKHQKVGNGKNLKMRYVFVKTEGVPEKCRFLEEKGLCSFSWKSGAKTDYFPPEYKAGSTQKFSEDGEEEEE